MSNISLSENERYTFAKVNGVPIIIESTDGAEDTNHFRNDVEITGSIRQDGNIILDGAVTIASDTVMSGNVHIPNVYTYSGGTSTLSDSDFDVSTLLLIDATSGTVTIKLPPNAVASNYGRIYYIKKITSTGTVTVEGANSVRKIDGAISKSATAQYAFLSVINSNVNDPGYVILSNSGFS